MAPRRGQEKDRARPRARHCSSSRRHPELELGMANFTNSPGVSGGNSQRTGRSQKINGPSTNGPVAPGLQLWNMGDDHDLPPPRRWLMANTFCKGFLSSVAAAGGVGKTALLIVQLLSC